jgi:hypothetical protein
VSESIQGAGSTASKEANKSMSDGHLLSLDPFLKLTHLLDVAKDNDASLSTRATAAKDAVGDKLDEKKHEV